MANPIALAMIALGLLLLIAGLVLMTRGSKVAGLVIVILGVILGATPLAATLIVAR